jgi:Iap family predicted aminopeptidase
MKKSLLKPTKKASKQPFAVKAYLVLYNAASVVAWGTVLFHLVNLLLDVPYSQIYYKISDLGKMS